MKATCSNGHDFEYEETDIKSHFVMCGDSTIAQNVHTLVPNNTTITFTSPPYNVGHNLGYKNKDSKYENDDDNKSEKEYGELLTITTALAQEVTKYQFINLQFLANNKRAILRWIGSERDRFVDIAFWRKLQVAPAMAENVMNSATEVIFILSSKDNASRAVDTANFRGTVSNFVETKSASSENENADSHNATYPIGFVTYFTDNFTKKGDSVYDPFCGTGTTLIACEQTDRTCYGMELDPKYVDVIRKRYWKFTHDGNEEGWEDGTTN